MTLEPEAMGPVAVADRRRDGCDQDGASRAEFKLYYLPKRSRQFPKVDSDDCGQKQRAEKEAVRQHDEAWPECVQTQ